MLTKPIWSRLFFESDSGTSSGGATEATEGKDGNNSKADANAGGKQGGEAAEFQPITSQEDFDAALAVRLARHEAKVKKSITDQVKAQLKADADAEAAKSQGNFEVLYKAEVEKRETAERELTTERQTALRARVAAKHKLPEELADVLRGDTEEDLTEHAKRLAKVVKTSAAPDTEVGTGGSGTGNSGPSDRPKPKPAATESATQPVYTFDGQKKIPFPQPNR